MGLVPPSTAVGSMASCDLEEVVIGDFHFE